MPLFWIDAHTPLPPSQRALGAGSDAPGLLAVGGSVTPQRLEEAYRRGIFPWYNPGQPPLWWTPDPRMVLPTADFRLSLSLRKTLRRFCRTPDCEIRIDHDVHAVMAACAGTPRSGQAGTWIVPELIDAYCAWQGHDGSGPRTHSVETWIDGRLAGGLYGVGIGAMFYGESMFAHRTDASKIALAALVAFCRAHGIALIDCQQHTQHLASFGAHEMPRPVFEAQLAHATAAAAPQNWTYHPGMWAQLGLSEAGGNVHAEPAPASRAAAGVQGASPA